MVLPSEYAEHLYRFIWKELIDNQCKLLRIGGIPNHIHMLIELHPSVALSVLMQNVKSHTSAWLKKDGRFSHFDGWAGEYYAATVSASFKDAVIEYIKSQPEHHKRVSFDDEFAEICRESGQICDERDLR